MALTNSLNICVERVNVLNVSSISWVITLSSVCLPSTTGARLVQVVNGMTACVAGKHSCQRGEASAFREV